MTRPPLSLDEKAVSIGVFLLPSTITRLKELAAENGAVTLSEYCRIVLCAHIKAQSKT